MWTVIKPTNQQPFKFRLATSTPTVARPQARRARGQATPPRSPHGPNRPPQLHPTAFLQRPRSGCRQRAFHTGICSRAAPPGSPSARGCGAPSRAPRQPPAASAHPLVRGLGQQARMRTPGSRVAALAPTHLPGRAPRNGRPHPAPQLLTCGNMAPSASPTSGSHVCAKAAGRGLQLTRLGHQRPGEAEVRPNPAPTSASRRLAGGATSGAELPGRSPSRAGAGRDGGPGALAVWAEG